MKLSILLMGVVAFTPPMLLAAPNKLNGRQNDVPNCVDGGEGPVDNVYGIGYECQDNCFFREQAEGTNKSGVCKGMCATTGGKVPLIRCNGRWFS